MRRVHKVILVLAAVVIAGITLPASAVDGVILIDQNKAMAGGVTPGDAPGFPVSINQPGSYRLAGNLTVPNENTTAIQIGADHVTIDLNGFAILGPTDCSGGLSPCARAGTGIGITTSGVAPRFNITVRNGTIQGMGNAGISLVGDGNRVESMHVRSNGDGGIFLVGSADNNTSAVEHCTVQRNGSEPLVAICGIIVSAGGIVRDNNVDVNFCGINLEHGNALYNVVTRNLHDGLILTNAGYIGNVLDGNNQNVSLDRPGTNLGQNLCNGAVCPGANF
jgi:hypothetical protein